MDIKFKLSSESAYWWLANIKKEDNDRWGADVPILFNGTVIPNFLHVTVEMGDCGDGLYAKAFSNVEMGEYADNYNPNTEVLVELPREELRMFENAFMGYMIAKKIDAYGTEYDYKLEYSIKGKQHMLIDNRNRLNYES